jgi:hypothetical protein
MQVKTTVRKKARIEIFRSRVIRFIMAAVVLVMLSMNKNKQIPVELPTGKVAPRIRMREACTISIRPPATILER